MPCASSLFHRPRSRVLQDGELVLKGEDLELERRSAPDARNYHIYEGHEDGSHARDATSAGRELPMISGTDGVFMRDNVEGESVVDVYVA